VRDLAGTSSVRRRFLLCEEPFVFVACAVVGGLCRLLGCRLAGAGLIIEDELFGVKALCTMLVEVEVPAVVPPIRVAGLEVGIVLGVGIVPGLVWVMPVGVELPKKTRSLRFEI
jgi:hydrogenase/urease accessory protein HupE